MRLLPGDLAAFESHEPRHDLQCVVTAPKPELGFDFLFHTGYDVRVPIHELTGSGNELTVIFRVIPQDQADKPSYGMQKVAVPPIAEAGGGEGRFYGTFALGEGKYHIDWLLRDRLDRACSMSWDLETRVDSKDSQLREWIPRGLVQLPAPLFAADPTVTRAPERGSPRFSIIVNFSPSDPSGDPADEGGIYGLLAILRRIGSDPRIVPYSIIICSLETQQVVYRQENQGGIDLPALGEALASVKLGTVDAKRLVSTNGPAQFAADLVREQLSKEYTDALVVLGPKEGVQAKVSSQALEPLDKLDKPAFYLSYDTKKQPSLWRDPISSIMKRLRGLEYGIHRPKDFFNAWSDVVTRMARVRGPHDSFAPAAVDR
jgi:hypothetical protein